MRRRAPVPSTVIMEEEPASELESEFGPRLEPRIEPEFAPEFEPEPTPEPVQAADTVYVPEGEKRVVTATGKVIESETELLQKKLEKRKEEVKQEGDSQAAVAMEAREKIEEVHKEYIFPPNQPVKEGQPEYVVF